MFSSLCIRPSVVPLFFASLLLCVYCSVPVSGSDLCGYRWSHSAGGSPQMTIDLEMLKKESLPIHPYITRDAYVERSYFSYLFSICSPFTQQNYPAQYNCRAPKISEGFTGSYQIYNQTSKGVVTYSCVELGDVEAGDVVQWSLLDENNPVLGVKSVHTGGEPCKNGKARSFTINFRCPFYIPSSHIISGNTQQNKPKTSDVSTTDRFDVQSHGEVTRSAKTIVGPVVEAQHCQYEVNVDTIYACPQDCRINIDDDGTPSLCSGNGICHMSSSNLESGTARCHCNAGYGGSFCESETTPGSGTSAETSLSIVAFILLIVLAGLSVGLYRKIVTLRKGSEGAAYGTLQGTAMTTRS